MMQTRKEHQTGVFSFGVFSKGRRVPGVHPFSSSREKEGLLLEKCIGNQVRPKTQNVMVGTRASGEEAERYAVSRHTALREDGALAHTALLGFWLWPTSPGEQTSGFQSSSRKPRGLCPICGQAGRVFLHFRHLLSSSSRHTPPSFSSCSHKTRVLVHTQQQMQAVTEMRVEGGHFTWAQHTGPPELYTDMLWGTLCLCLGSWHPL